MPDEHLHSSAVSAVWFRATSSMMLKYRGRSGQRAAKTTGRSHHFLAPGTR